MFAIASDAATGVTTLIAGIPLIFPMQSMLQPSPNGFEKVEHNGNVYFVERED